MYSWVYSFDVDMTQEGWWDPVEKGLEGSKFESAPNSLRSLCSEKRTRPTSGQKQEDTFSAELGYLFGSKLSPVGDNVIQQTTDSGNKLRSIWPLFESAQRSPN